MKTTLVIFGITGDLAQRKLLPALSRVIAAGKCEELRIIGVSRREVEQFEVLGEHHERLSGTTSLYQMDLENLDDYKQLKAYIAADEDEQTLFYLSVPPDSVSNIIEHLGQSGLNESNNKLLLEKPFGKDLDSAKSLIAHTAKYFDESQVYRIDHFLAKEMAQNIVAFRAQNAIFAYLWSSQYIESIEVVAYEEIGIEGRATFYEQTGALRDVVQGHLMQLLALVLLPLSGDLDWDGLPERRLSALTELRPANPEKSCRAQYIGYRNEVNNPDSMVETFVSIELQSKDPTWQGVPLFLRTGKALDGKKTEVRVHFRHSNEKQSDSLIFKIQPDEGIEIDLVTKKPGYEQELEHQKLSYMYPPDTRLPDAYEQVLVDAINSRKSLFATNKEVLRAWEILYPLQEAWGKSSELKMYASGSAVNTLVDDCSVD